MQSVKRVEATIGIETLPGAHKRGIARRKAGIFCTSSSQCLHDTTHSVPVCHDCQGAGRSSTNKVLRVLKSSAHRSDGALVATLGHLSQGHFNSATHPRFFIFQAGGQRVNGTLVTRRRHLGQRQDGGSTHPHVLVLKAGSDRGDRPAVAPGCPVPQGADNATSFRRAQPRQAPAQRLHRLGLEPRQLSQGLQRRGADVRGGVLQVRTQGQSRAMLA
mmetsp:Transcript_143796/g.460317  ORF Transcript_143796/g.460317 Transcript_143796/m.460317 type:complete len:217 (-) Transcript_143796:1076-1726(-)